MDLNFNFNHAVSFCFHTLVVRVASLTLFTTLSSNANSINELCVLIIVFLFNDFTSEFLSLIFFSLSVSSCAICFFLGFRKLLLCFSA
jgi:hypothetical protein